MKQYILTQKQFKELLEGAEELINCGNSHEKAEGQGMKSVLDRISKGTKKRKKYQILSPDGFPINREGYFTSKKKSEEYYERWKESFKPQGFYSSTQSGRIPLMDLHKYCQFLTV